MLVAFNVSRALRKSFKNETVGLVVRVDIMQAHSQMLLFTFRSLYSVFTNPLRTKMMRCQ